jgi:hypothetical protein
MSSGDFEADLQQSVQDHATFIRNAADAAKARVQGQVGDAGAVTPAATPPPPSIASYDCTE